MINLCFLFNLATVYKSFLMQSFSHLSQTKVWLYSDLHKIDMQCSSVPCSDVQSRSALFRSMEMRSSTLVGKEKRPLIQVHFYAFPPTSANTRTLSYTSKTAHKLWAETHLEQCWQWPRESAVTLTSICQLDAVVCSPAIIFGFQNKSLSRLAKCVVLP